MWAGVSLLWAPAQTVFVSTEGVAITPQEPSMVPAVPGVVPYCFERHAVTAPDGNNGGILDDRSQRTQEDV